MVGASFVRSFVVVAPGVDMMFKAGSFEIRRLISVQVPQSNLNEGRSDAILHIRSREQNLSTRLKIRRFLQSSFGITRQIRNLYYHTGPLQNN